MSGGVVSAVAVTGLAWGVEAAARRVHGRARARNRAARIVGTASTDTRWTAEALRRRARARPEWACLAAGAVLAGAGGSVLPLATGCVAVPLVRRRLAARAAAKARERRAEAVRELCGALAQEVRSGRQPVAALLHAVGEARGLGGAEAGVLAAARFGGDVAGALREAAGEPGAEGLSGLAACWEVAVDRGAGLAAGVERLAAALRAERDQAADLLAQLAGARSTVLMLAALPLLGLVLGWAMGAGPLRVLLHTPAGLACLLLGSALESAGLWWALGIVRRAGARR
ncbi:type II secretion system F family protein [Streptomyces sp. NPDC058374]|uniref:type II secretion system F family protein n=1 Tax=unclassified Streptomyces TaxID=2593676 RepID=UPI0036618997